MFGRMYNEAWGITAAAFIIFGFNATFIPQFLLGNAGQPRRYFAYDDIYWVLNVASTAGATLQALGFIMIFLNLAYALKNGAIAGDNPWGASGLEWRTTSPPPKHNFAETPIVDEDAYTYQKKGEKVEHVVV
jgi:cytochrome c oxidase subunit 1